MHIEQAFKALKKIIDHSQTKLLGRGEEILLTKDHANIKLYMIEN